MRKQFRDEGYNQYVTIELQEGNHMEQSMLLNNEIQGLLPCRLRTIDGGHVLDYQIDGRSSFDQFADQMKIDKSTVVMLINGVIKTVRNLRSYLLKPDGILLEMDAIYLKEDQKELEFCYVPGLDQNIIKQLIGIIEILMKQLNHKDEKDVLFVYGLYRFLGESNTSVAALEEYLEKEKRREEREELKELSITKIDLQQKKKQTLSSDGEWSEVPFIEAGMGTSDKIARKSKNSIKGMGIQRKNKNIDTRLEKDIKRKTKSIRSESQTKKSDIDIKLENQTKSGNIDGEIETEKQDRKNRCLYLILQMGSIGLLFVFLFFTGLFFWKRMWKNGAIGIVFIIVDLYFIYERGKEYTGFKHPCIDDESENSDRTSLLSEMPEEQKQYYPYLVPEQKHNERILIVHTPLIVGCLPEAVDYVVEGKGISRIHASIEQEAGRYYIRDLNSTNGTYWNGELLMPQVPKELEESDQIILGDQLFRFQLEESY